MNAIKSRLDAIEKYLKQRNPAVGVILPQGEGWILFFDGREANFLTEDEAAAAFRRLAGPDATLIIW